MGEGCHLTESQTLEHRIQTGELGSISEKQKEQLLNLSRSVEKQKEMTEETKKVEEETKKVKETLANAFQQGLEHGPKAFFKSLFDSFKQTILKMESEWAASKVMQFLFPTKPGTSGASTSRGAVNPGEKAHP